MAFSLLITYEYDEEVEAIRSSSRTCAIININNKEWLQVEDTHKLQTFEMQNEVLLTVEKHEEILAIINGSHAAQLIGGVA